MLKTEMRNEKTRHIDKMSTMEMLEIINNETRNAVDAVEDAFFEIAKAVDAITQSMRQGGRLFYIGAGTSGRLGVMDAAECPPTYGVSKDLVIGIIAGGDTSMVGASENNEDDADAGIADFLKYNPTEKDVLVGISAAGGARYVLSAIEKAKQIGCVTVGLTCNKGCPLDWSTDISICTDTGPEVITGSTRMKAGTAQKLVLNMLSTCSMIKTGRVYENLMIDLKPSNEKLRDRMIGMVTELTGLGREEAQKELDSHHWNLREVLDISQ